MDYEKIYHDMGIPINPLPDNYDPDIYARELMKNMIYPKDVSYAASLNDKVYNYDSKDNK